jgi:Gpi18-like mannosyltransferase
MRRSLKISLFILSAVLIGVSLLFRYEGLKFISFDVINFVFPWYEYVQQYGLREALRHDFLNYNYSLAYLYLIALASETSSFLNRGSYHKLFGFLFDVFGAFVIFKIVFHKYKDFALSLLAGSIFFTLPTIILNSSYWGQADNIYTVFLLCCVYFVLKDRPVWAAVSWGAAFSFKLQAIFLLPFLLFCILIKKLKWWHLALSALTFLVIMAPAVIVGRPFIEIFNPYLSQSAGSPLWIYNSPSLYALFLSRLPENSPDFIVLPAVGLIILAWVIISVRNFSEGDDDYILGMALGSVVITAFLLPHMHERYFFPADALSLVFAFYVPNLFVLPIFFQISSYMVYRNYLYYDFERTYDLIRIFWAAFINLISILIFLGWQFYYHRILKAKSGS